ncbi:fructose-6-phosphate aldolase [Pectobacterium aroidearum]|uniref:fructose-6-phosphate aldolase n=1 Tax=Pectobacterium aroidearum TaxID=1201031 RepID=UPI0015F5432D|nr:fructose-6-phosphate aldolase [Pectobacterium aroidearum]MBA5602231.1 fructose-6-phosphate aldolase [Pectobacterium aroidearum]
MEFYLDTADVAAVERLASVLPIKGVTTNPSIVARGKADIYTVLREMQAVVGPEGQLFAQVMARDPDVMVAEALKLRDVIPSLVVKVPVTHAGLVAIKRLTELDVPTLGTAVYGAGQGFYAALAGARYIAPYVNRIDAQGGDGIALVKELQTLINLHSPQTQVLAASFRTPRQVLDCLLAGCRAITVDPAVAELFLQDPAVDDALNRFDHDWQARFGHADLG